MNSTYQRLFLHATFFGRSRSQYTYWSYNTSADIQFNLTTFSENATEFCLSYNQYFNTKYLIVMYTLLKVQVHNYTYKFT